MDHYISREKLLSFPLRRNGEHLDKEHANPHFVDGIETVMEYAETLPTTEVAPVVHAKWIPAGTFDDFAKCSACGNQDHPLHAVCGGYSREPYNYCPHCGAKMDLDN